MAKNRMKIPNSLFSFSYYTNGANKENGVGNFVLGFLF